MRRYPLVALLLAALMVPAGAGAAESPVRSLADADDILWTRPSEIWAGDAVALLERLAEQGDAEAQLRLGRMYWTGDYVAIDTDKAISLLTAAASQGNAEAQWMLGEVHSSGILGPRDYAEMAKWYLMAAEAGDPRAQYAVAQLAAPDDFIRSITPSAAPVLPKDDTVALAWLQKAAEGGWPPAQRQLANRYVYGFGVPMDEAKYRHWINLGLADLEPSLPKGFDITEEMREAESTTLSGDLSFVEGIEFMISRSNRGYGYFGWSTGNMLKLLLTEIPEDQAATDASSEELPPRPELVRLMVKSFESSARAGYPSGMEDYGRLLIEGKAVARDVERGSDLLRRAALKGDGYAAGHLGWKLAFKDEFRQAYVWLLIGGKLGAPIALEGLRLQVLPHVDEKYIKAYSTEANRLAREHGLEFYRLGNHRQWCFPTMMLQCQ